MLNTHSSRLPTSSSANIKYRYLYATEILKFCTVPGTWLMKTPHDRFCILDGGGGKEKEEGGRAKGKGEKGEGTKGEGAKGEGAKGKGQGE